MYVRCVFQEVQKWREQHTKDKGQLARLVDKVDALEGKRRFDPSKAFQARSKENDTSSVVPLKEGMPTAHAYSLVLKQATGQLISLFNATRVQGLSDLENSSEKEEKKLENYSANLSKFVA